MKKLLVQTLRYWHTLRKLKPIQILNRFQRKIPHASYQASTERIEFLNPKAIARFINKPQRTKTGQEFEFIGHAEPFCSPESWFLEAPSKLWLYNLHYFDDINSAQKGLPADFSVKHIKTWIEDNQSRNSVGWEPYPNSLRIVNWVKWLIQNPTDADRTILESLVNQSDYLSKTIEWHLMANHLFVNAKALFFAGCFLRANRAANWYEKGLSIIRTQVREQVLFDGGNFELSPMYHRIQLEDLLDIINIANHAPIKSEVLSEDLNYWRSVASKMLDWSAAMSHPDGEVAFFNDSSMDIARSHAELREYAARLKIAPASKVERTSKVRVFNFPDSGFICVSMGDTQAIYDVGTVGPDYQPGHAHADTLSFELSINGQRAIVNGGTSTYDIGETRARERGTYNHNTVQIGLDNSSDVWSSHRVGLRARPSNLQVTKKASTLRVSCEHDGYRYLAGRPVHKREWFIEPGQLQITDEVSCKEYKSIARFRIHPALKLEEITNHSYKLVSQTGELFARVNIIKGQSQIEKSTYSPKFGLILDTFTIAARLVQGQSIIRVSWQEK